MYKGYSISVVIPCHNEERSIEWTFKKIPEFIDEVIVVDNVSTDNTSGLAKKLGARVITEKNRGYGHAIKKGVSQAKGDIVITIDGDGTYPIEDSGKVVDYFISQQIDFLSCSRFPLNSSGSMNWQNYLGNRIVSLLMSILFFKWFQDGLSGMWIFRKNIYHLLLPLSSNWNISEEIKIEALRNPSIKFDEYHIKYHSRFGGKSKVWPLKVGSENIYYLFYLRFFKKRNV